MTIEPMAEIARCFRQVYVNQASKVVLLHGGVPFCQRLQISLEKFREGSLPVGYQEETWTSMAVEAPSLAEETLQVVTPDVEYWRVQDFQGWYKDLRKWGVLNAHKVRIVDFRELTLPQVISGMLGVSPQLSETRTRDCFRTLAQEFSSVGRRDLKRCLFLFPSESLGDLQALQAEITREWESMSVCISAKDL
jgi:hypothetical protein